MRCGAVRRHLSAYVDERVNARIHLAIGLHLSCCQGCRGRYEELRRLYLALLGSPHVPVPAEFRAGWRNAIRRELSAREPRRRPWFMGVTTLAPAAACLILIVAGAVLFVPRMHGGSQPSQRAQPAGKEPQNHAMSLVKPASPRSQARVPEAAAVDDRHPAAEGIVRRGTEPLSAMPGGSIPSGEPGAVTRGADATRPSEQEDTGLARETSPSAKSAGQTLGEGSWRVWLASFGENPNEVRIVLTAAGIRLDDRETTTAGAVLLCEGRPFTAAKSLAQQLEDVGGHTVIEFVPGQ